MRAHTLFGLKPFETALHLMQRHLSRKLINSPMQIFVVMVGCDSMYQQRLCPQIPKVDTFWHTFWHTRSIYGSSVPNFRTLCRRQSIVIFFIAVTSAYVWATGHSHPPSMPIPNLLRMCCPSASASSAWHLPHEHLAQCAKIWHSVRKW